MRLLISATWVLIPSEYSDNLGQNLSSAEYEEQITEKLIELGIDMSTMATVPLDLPFNLNATFSTIAQCENVRSLKWKDLRNKVTPERLVNVIFKEHYSIKKTFENSYIPRSFVGRKN